MSLVMEVSKTQGAMAPPFREIIKLSGTPRHLFIIPLKVFHLFKIAKLVINLYLKFFSN